MQLSVLKHGQSLLGLFIWVLSIGLAAAAPVNDNFANRTLIPSIPATVSGNSTGSTTEVGDPMSERSIWWKFTPQETGPYIISAAPGYSNYFTMHLYSGNSLNTLVRQTGQPVFGGPPYTLIEKFQLTAGVEYSILVGANIYWEEGPVTLTVTRNNSPSVSITNPNATTPYYHGNQLELRVNASDSDGSVARVDYYFDVNYVEGVSQPVASSTVPPFSATITLPSVGNYRQNMIAVATDNNGAKTISTSLSFAIMPYTAHDFFADRKQITGERVLEKVNNQHSTSEAGESGTGSNSIWWSWTAPASETFVITSRAWPGGFYPRLDVYTGSAINQLTSVGSDAFTGTSNTYTAQVALTATAGQTYAIRVTTVQGMGGETTLSILPQAAPGTPPQVENLSLTEDGKIEFMVLTNSAPQSELQSSPNLKDWTPVISSRPYPANGYFKEVITRPADAAYFYRIIEKVPPP